MMNMKDQMRLISSLEMQEMMSLMVIVLMTISMVAKVMILLKEMKAMIHISLRRIMETMLFSTLKAITRSYSTIHSPLIIMIYH